MINFLLAKLTALLVITGTGMTGQDHVTGLPPCCKKFCSSKIPGDLAPGGVDLELGCAGPQRCSLTRSGLCHKRCKNNFAEIPGKCSADSATSACHNLQVISTIVSSSYIRCMAYDPKGLLLATCSADGSLRIWEIATKKLVIQLRGAVPNVSTCPFALRHDLCDCSDLDANCML